MNKKSITAMQVVIAAIILVVVAVVIIFIFRTYISKEASIVGEQISSLGDCDCDDVRNFMDKCPCIPAGDNPSEEHDGCPKGTNPTKCAAELEKECAEKGEIESLCKK